MRIFTLLFAILGISSSLYATPITRPTGTIKVNSSPYSCADKTCHDLTVTCPDVKNSIGVVLYVSAPSAQVPYKGTVTLHSGSGGRGFWASETNSTKVLNDVIKAGFRAVQVKWKTTWYQGDAVNQEGLKRLACRPASVLKWVHDNLYTEGAQNAFCATGNSGGSVQVSIPLVHYGLSDYLDLVVPTSGPGMGRLDTGCNDSNSSLYLDTQRGIFDATYGYRSGAGPCTKKTSSFLNQFIQDSLALGDEGNFYYPTTMIWNLGGVKDHTATTAQSQTVFDRWSAAGTPYLHREILSGVGHSVQQTVTGANRISEVLLTNCRKNP